jgi:hypothetical protein
MLGLKTVLVRHGKHKDLVPKDKFEVSVVTVEIANLVELKDMI